MCRSILLLLLLLGLAGCGPITKDLSPDDINRVPCPSGIAGPCNYPEYRP